MRYGIKIAGQKMTRLKEKVAVIDLFCGAGGLTHGLKKEGFDVRVGVDLDPACKYAYEANNKATYLERDISDVSEDDLKEYFEGADYTLLAGCAPCQPFSKYTQGKDTSTDQKWSLLRQFSRLVSVLEPDFVTMENVPELARHSIIKEFTEQLVSLNYQVVTKVIDCSEYGVPQSRERLVIMASRHLEAQLEFPSARSYHRRTVRSTIGALPRIGAGDMDDKDPLHRTSSLSPLNLKRIRASKPGGTWRDWPEQLVAACHKESSGKTYVSVYGRMTWDEPAPTMTTQCFGFGNGRFGHPDQHRAISLREAALFQTFPPNYKFEPEGVDLGMKALGRMIGNAVPVQLGKVIAKGFKKHINTLNDLKNEAP